MILYTVLSKAVRTFCLNGFFCYLKVIKVSSKVQLDLCLRLIRLAKGKFSLE